MKVPSSNLGRVTNNLNYDLWIQEKKLTQKIISLN